MKKSKPILLALFAVFALKARCEAASPLELVQTIPMPGITGHLDHFGLDLRHHRLFLLAEDCSRIEVFDLRNNKLIHTISDAKKPHSMLYRGDLDEIFVTDGTDGSLKIFNGKTYNLIKTVKLLEDADDVGYDTATHYLYITNGGRIAHNDYGSLSIVDTNTGEHVGDIRIDESNDLEEMALEKSTSELFLNARDKGLVVVIDRTKRKVLTSWPITRGKRPVTMQMDEANHRLFVGCLSGDVVVFDSATGREITSFPITKGVDDMVYDRASKRIYTASGGEGGAVDVYEQVDPDHYQSIAKIPTAPLAKTAILVPELKRYFVGAAQNGNTDAQIMVYKVM
jgi:DNA-binding beta-propeller fold protein YncE